MSTPDALLLSSFRGAPLVPGEPVASPAEMPAPKSADIHAITFDQFLSRILRR